MLESKYSDIESLKNKDDQDVFSDIEMGIPGPEVAEWKPLPPVDNLSAYLNGLFTIPPNAQSYGA